MCAASPQAVMCTLLGAPGVASKGGKQSSWTSNLRVVYSLHRPGVRAVYIRRASRSWLSRAFFSLFLSAVKSSLHFCTTCSTSGLWCMAEHYMLGVQGYLPVATYQWVTYQWIHWFLLSRTCQDCSLCVLAVARW